MTDPYGNSWPIDGANTTGNRPDGKPFNADFSSIKDFEKEACVTRVIGEGGSAEDGRREWEAQWLASSEDEQEAYEIFYLSSIKHVRALIAARRQKEDAQLARRKSMEEERRALGLDQRRLAEGETAEDRLEEGLRQAAQVAALLAPAVMSVGASATNFAGTLSGANKIGGNVGNMKLHVTVDGLEIWTDVKAANAIIGPNLSLYRTCEATKLRRQMDHSGIGWTIEQALLTLDEDRQRLENRPQIVPSDPHFALAFWSDVEGNPGFMDRKQLEALVRMQFRSTDHCVLHYLMFYPFGKSEVKIFDRMTHLACLGAIQKIWWIFLGTAWRGVLQPLMDRLTEGDLAHYFRVGTHLPQLQSAHHLLTYQVQSAFCMVGSVVRLNEPRLKQSSEQRSISALVLEVQGFFAEIVTPGNSADATAARLLEFSASGKLAAAEETIEKLKKKTTVIVTPPKKKKAQKAEDSEDEPQAKSPRSQDSVCLRNVMLQFFGKRDGLGDECDESCFFRHTPVNQITQAQLDKATKVGTAIFGEAFTTGGWKKKLEDAYGGTATNNRQRPLMTPSGTLIEYKPSGGGRGGGRGRGRGRGRGNRG